MLWTLNITDESDNIPKRILLDVEKEKKSIFIRELDTGMTGSQAKNFPQKIITWLFKRESWFLQWTLKE